MMKKEIPILFNGEMVRAILDGRKTQTRRPVKAPKSMLEEWEVESVNDAYDVGMSCNKDGALFLFAGDQGYDFIKSPFGKPGDVLWVRESCLISPEHFTDKFGQTHPNGRIVQYLASYPDREAAESYFVTKATPSIHMPKWACRIKLKVKRVWVERVQDISEEDSENEGVQFTCPCGSIVDISDPESHWMCESDDGLISSYKQGFLNIWNSIYQGSSKRNDWVWCCEFEKQEESCKS